MENYSSIIKYFRDECPDHNHDLIVKIDLSKAICEAFSIPVDDLFKRKRNGQIIDARRFYLYVLNKVLNYGPAKTARYTGWDHASVIYHSRKCLNLMETEIYYRNRTNQVLTELKYERINIPTHAKLIET